MCTSFLFPNSVNIFITNPLSSLSYRLFICFSICFSRFLLLCPLREVSLPFHFAVFGFLQAESLWFLLIVESAPCRELGGGLAQWFVKVSWLGELVSVFWWVKLDLCSLECNAVSSREYWGVCGFGMALGACLLMFRVVFLFCWRISMVWLALKLIGSWV